MWRQRDLLQDMAEDVASVMDHMQGLRKHDLVRVRGS